MFHRGAFLPLVARSPAPIHRTTRFLMAWLVGLIPQPKFLMALTMILLRFAQRRKASGLAGQGLDKFQNFHKILGHGSKKCKGRRSLSLSETPCNVVIWLTASTAAAYRRPKAPDACQLA